MAKVTIELEDYEARTLALLLDTAAESYSNHGCNDFHVGKELGLTPEKAEEVAILFRKKMVEQGMVDEEYAEEGGPYLMDWLLMRYFEKLLKNLQG